jgi:hypothetical protein
MPVHTSYDALRPGCKFEEEFGGPVSREELTTGRRDNWPPSWRLYKMEVHSETE